MTISAKEKKSSESGNFGAFFSPKSFIWVVWNYILLPSGKYLQQNKIAACELYILLVHWEENDSFCQQWTPNTSNRYEMLTSTAHVNGQA